MHTPLPTALRYSLTLAYAYGAAVHLANIAGVNGFDWGNAPLRWQLLDVFYLVLDVIVVWGLLFRTRLGVCAFMLAAVSQILLYTVFRDWVLDVPTEIMPSAEQQAYLSKLVAFHVVSLTLVMVALRRARQGVAALLVIPIVASSLSPVDASPPMISGLWSSPGLAMVVRFEPCPDAVSTHCGRLVWSWEGDDLLKHKFGSLVLRDIRPDGEHWRGTLLDPSNGRRYKGTVQRIDQHTLQLRGCLGPFCQSQTWRSLDSVSTTLTDIIGSES